MYKYGNLEFEWDPVKETQNIMRHGVSFSEAMQVFRDPWSFTLNDLKHSDAEARYYRVGRINIGQVLTVYYTTRKHRVRLIGCAEWRKYRRLYYERTQVK